MGLQLGLSLPVAPLFAAVHVLGRDMEFLRSTPRSAWLPAAGGASVAYVFVHLLPGLAEHQGTVAARVDEAVAGGRLGGIERHVHVVALAGLAVFYGLDRFARSSARRRAARGEVRRPAIGVFWLHLGSYALYNALIGYLLLQREEETDLRGLIVHAVATGLRFAVDDQGLREHRGEAYDRVGRWLLAAAPVLGRAAGLAVEVPPLALAALFAFLAGGVALDVLKEELPEERQSRFPAFPLGTTAYAALLPAAR